MVHKAGSLYRPLMMRHKPFDEPGVEPARKGARAVAQIHQFAVKTAKKGVVTGAAMLRGTLIRMRELVLATLGSFLYHLRVMVKALPKRFNPYLLARDGTRFELKFPQSQMQRLSGILSTSENDVQVTALFSRRKDLIVISGRLTTVYSVECQRCLEPMNVEVSEPFELVFVENEDKAIELPKELDPVILDDKGQIHVADLFEDELILHVPEIPKHSDVAACELSQTEFGELPADIEEGKSNPFEALKKLNLH